MIPQNHKVKYVGVMQSLSKRSNYRLIHESWVALRLILIKAGSNAHVLAAVGFNVSGRCYRSSWAPQRLHVGLRVQDWGFQKSSFVLAPAG